MHLCCLRPNLAHTTLYTAIHALAPHLHPGNKAIWMHGTLGAQRGVLGYVLPLQAIPHTDLLLQATSLVLDVANFECVVQLPRF